MIKPATTDFPRFEAPYAGDDDQLIRSFAARLSLSESQNGAIDRRATTYIEAIRDNSGSVGGVEDFLREYGLSTREGLALMVLAEAETNQLSPCASCSLQPPSFSLSSIRRS